MTSRPYWATRPRKSWRISYPSVDSVHTQMEPLGSDGPIGNQHSLGLQGPTTRTAPAVLTPKKLRQLASSCQIPTGFAATFPLGVAKSSGDLRAQTKSCFDTLQPQLEPHPPPVLALSGGLGSLGRTNSGLLPPTTSLFATQLLTGSAPNFHIACPYGPATNRYVQGVYTPTAAAGTRNRSPGYWRTKPS